MKRTNRVDDLPSEYFFESLKTVMDLYSVIVKNVTAQRSVLYND